MLCSLSVAEIGEAEGHRCSLSSLPGGCLQYRRQLLGKAEYVQQDAIAITHLQGS